MSKINGELIKEAREKKGLTQKELGKIIGVTKTTICWYEIGERIPRYSNIVKLCEALDLTIEEITGREVYADVVSDNNEEYKVNLAKQDITILNELKKRPKLYRKLYRDPVRTIELIERRLK